MIRFDVEPLALVADEIAPLWERHYEEGAEDREIAPFAPDWRRYFMLEEGGNLLLLTARTDDGTMVGYLMAIIDTHLHFSRTVFAGVDVYWLAPEHRGGRTALRMLKTAEACFKAMGAHVVLQHAWHVRGQERLLARMGYAPMETVMKKVL